ncbi:hypothetical protein ACLK1Y_18935 [Escherichia coli]
MVDKFAHFDEESFVERLLNHPEVPELIITSPLTQREWQVVGVILGLQQRTDFAGELDVAATTIETPLSATSIRNFGVAHGQIRCGIPPEAAEDDRVRRVSLAG